MVSEQEVRFQYFWCNKLQHAWEGAGSVTRVSSQDKLSRQMMKQRRSVASARQFLSGSVTELNRMGDSSILTTSKRGRKSVIDLSEVGHSTMWLAWLVMEQGSLPNLSMSTSRWLAE